MTNKGPSSMFQQGGMKPWMQNRPGESDEERVERLMWTCFACGVEIHEETALNLHQDQCDGKQPVDPGVWRY